MHESFGRVRLRVLECMRVLEGYDESFREVLCEVQRGMEGYNERF